MKAIANALVREKDVYIVLSDENAKAGGGEGYPGHIFQTADRIKEYAPALDADIPLTYMTRLLVTGPSVSVAPSVAVASDVGVEAFVDGQGYVYDFRIIRLPGSYPEPDRILRAQLAHALLSARFDPATRFGRPTLGRVLLSFRPTTQVHVRG